MSAFLGVPVDAAYHLVSSLAAVLAPLLGTLGPAAAIVLFTMAVRLVLVPLSYRAMKGMDTQAKMAPQVQALRKQHSGQPEAFQRALAALYRAEGTSAYAGCLPALLQWPLFSVMYLVFRSPVIGGARNALLGHDMFGAPLGSYWLSGAGPFSAQGAVFAGLFLLLAGIGWVTARTDARVCRPVRGRGSGSGSGSGRDTSRADEGHPLHHRRVRSVRAARVRAVPGHDHRVDPRRTAAATAARQPPRRQARRQAATGAGRRPPQQQASDPRGERRRRA